MNLLKNYIVLLDCGNWDRTQDFIKYVGSCYHIQIWTNDTTSTILLTRDDFEELINYSKNDSELLEDLEVFQEIDINYLENY